MCGRWAYESKVSGKVVAGVWLVGSGWCVMPTYRTCTTHLLHTCRRYTRYTPDVHTPDTHTPDTHTSDTYTPD